MAMYIEHVDRFDPITEAEKPWVDRSGNFASDNYRRIQAETKAVQNQKLNPEDKIEFNGPVEKYRSEQLTMPDATKEALEQSKREYLMDDKRQVEMSVVYKGYYRDGVGIHLDQIV